MERQQLQHTQQLTSVSIDNEPWIESLLPNERVVWILLLIAHDKDDGCWLLCVVDIK